MTCLELDIGNQDHDSPTRSKTVVSTNIEKKTFNRNKTQRGIGTPNAEKGLDCCRCLF